METEEPAKINSEAEPKDDLTTLINHLEYYTNVYDPEGARKYFEALGRLKALGDKGVDLLVDAINDGLINPCRGIYNMEAIKFPGEAHSPYVLRAFHKLLLSERVLETSDRSARYKILEILSQNDQLDSIPYIVKFSENRMEKIRREISYQDSPVEVLTNIDLTGALLDLNQSISLLQNFSDREGYIQAEKLYQVYEQVRDKIEDIRGQLRTRLPSFYARSDEVSLAQFPVANKRQERKINSLIDRIQYGREVDIKSLAKLGLIGEVAIPPIYRAILEGRLKGREALSIVSIFSTHDVLPIYHYLLLNTVDESGVVPGYLISQMGLFSNHEPSSIPVLAEFARRSAELVIQTDDDIQKIVSSKLFNLSLKALINFKEKDAKHLTKLLLISYPEFNTRYEEVVPKIENPSEIEKKRWSHNKIFIRGSALFATLLGRGKDKVRDLDIFLTYTTDSSYDALLDRVKTIYLDDIDELARVLSMDEVEKIKGWVAKNGYWGLRINLVRIPEEDLTTGEIFKDEPKLLIWQEAGITPPLGIDELINTAFPEKLIPNSTLARALRTMDLSERFGFEFEPALLEEAEKAIKDGKLILSHIPINQLTGRRRELSGEPVLDVTFIKVFQDKNLKKPLLKRYPRLGQLAEEIIKVGDLENYISSVYGMVYLNRGHVRLYDIKLAKSPSSTADQEQFVHKWYTELGPKLLDLLAWDKLSDSTDLPRSEELERLIKQDKLDAAVERRGGKNSFLDGVSGTYRLDLANTDPTTLREKITAFLQVMNMEWPAHLDRSKVKVSQSLIKLGVHPKNPILGQFDSSKQEDIDLVISSDPKAILGASTDKPWYSCVHLDSEDWPDSTYEDIAGASVIAYLVKSGEFVARSIIRAGFSLDKFQQAAAVEKMYGDMRYKKVMREALEKILASSGIRINTTMVTYPFGREAYFDGNDSTIEVGDHTSYIYR